MVSVSSSSPSPSVRGPKLSTLRSAPKCFFCQKKNCTTFRYLTTQLRCREHCGAARRMHSREPVCETPARRLTADKQALFFAHRAYPHPPPAGPDLPPWCNCQAARSVLETKGAGAREGRRSAILGLIVSRIMQQPRVLRCIKGTGKRG